MRWVQAVVLQRLVDGSFQAVVMEIADECDVKQGVQLAPLKGKARAAEKVQDDYGGDWTRVIDIVPIAGHWIVAWPG